MRWRFNLSKLFIAILIALSLGMSFQSPSPATAITNDAPLVFIENVGQLNNQVHFQVRSNDRTFWLVEDGLWITIDKPARQTPEVQGYINSDPKSNVGLAVKLSFPGSNPHPRLEPLDRLNTHVSSFMGNDSAKWYSDLPAWSGVRYVDLYPGINWEITSRNGQLVQRLVVQNDERYPHFSTPGSTSPLDSMQLRVEGANIETVEDDHLYLFTALGEFTLPLLQVVSVEGDYLDLTPKPIINGADIIAPFSHSSKHSLSIPAQDPSNLLYSTFVGGGNNDYAGSVVLDPAGNIVITGATDSSNFPTSAGVFDSTHNGSNDIFISKLAADGSSLLYSTFVGGGGFDGGRALTLDTAGNVVVTGVTRSSNFPTTAGVFDITHNGEEDIFVIKLAADGGSLLYSTYIGGSSRDEGDGLALDSAGNVVVTGMVRSSNFPTTAGAYDTTFNGPVDDVFVLKLAANGASLLFSTYVGGTNNNEVGYAVVLDGGGNAVVAGRTDSSDFPTTAGAFDTTYNGGYDVFLLKLAADGGSLVYSTYVGGSSNENDLGFSLGMDAASNVVFTGRTYSSNFPTTVGAYDTTHNGSSDVFVLKLAANGGSLVYSTFIGGSGIEEALSLALDAAGNVVVTGGTDSSNFPVSEGAYDATYNGSYDVFLVKLAADGGSLLYSTYMGGSGDEYGRSVAVDTTSNIIFTGFTTSSNFPTTVGAYDTTHNGSSDVFVAKLATTISPPPSTNHPPTVDAGGPYSIPEGASTIVMATGSDPDNDSLTYAWDLANNGSFETAGQMAFFLATNLDGPITKTITAQITDTGNLTATDQAIVNISNAPPSANFANTSGDISTGQTATLAFTNPSDPSVADTSAGFRYSYDCTNDGNFEQVDSTTPSYDCIYPLTGTFTARGRIADKDNGFNDYTAQVKVNPSVPSLVITTDSPLPNGTVNVPYSVTLAAIGGTPPYTWSIASGALPPGLGLNAATGEISGTPTTAGTFGFTVQVTDSSAMIATKQFALAPPPSSGTPGLSYTMPISVVDTPPDGSGTPSCNNYQLVSGTLPAGLTLDPSTGIISGTPTDGGTYTFTVQCVVSGGQTATKEFTITIENPTPILAGLDPNSAIVGGGAFSLTVNGSNFVGSSIVQWNGTSRPTHFVSMTQLTAQIYAEDISSEGTASVTVVNPAPNGGTSNALDFTVNRNQQPPTAQAGGPYSVPEGSSVTLNGSGSDPDGGPLTYAWDLNNDGSFETPGQSVTFSAAGRDGPSEQPVVLQVCDPSNACATAGTMVTIVNVDPTITSLTNNGPIQEGGSATITAAVADPAGANDPLSYEFDCNNDGAYDIGPQPDNSASCTFADNGNLQVTVRVKDDDGGQATSSTTVVVNNVAPTVNTISAPADPIQVNTAINASTSFTDSGVLDTHTAVWDWGDGNTSPGTVNETNGSGSANDSHTYTTPGTYNIKLTVTDKDGGSGQSNLTVIVVGNNVIYNFSGFFPPVDNPPTLNVLKAGQAVPVKFSLGGDQGLDILESSYPKSQTIACDLSGGVSDIEETVNTGNSSLSYDPSSDQYSYVWKTKKDWKGSCRQFVLRLKDGTEHLANFQLK